VPSHVDGNVPKASFPSTGTVDGATVGVAGAGDGEACPAAAGEAAEAVPQPLTTAASPATATHPAAMPLILVMPILVVPRLARTRGLPAPMEVLAFIPPPAPPNFSQRRPRP
jgi:hypothetical protein